MFFDEKISLFQIEAETKEEALEKLSAELYNNNFVKEGFYSAILAREKEFPTGLPTIPYGVAIPHTEVQYIKKPQIAFASLKKPVIFKAMGNAEEDVEVSIIFMLALNKAEDQLEMLQKLVAVFQKEYLIEELAKCSNKEQYERVLNQATLTLV